LGQLETLRGELDKAAWLERELQVGFLEGSDVARIALAGSRPEELAKLVNAVKDAYMFQIVQHEQNEQVALLQNIEKVYSDQDEKLRKRRQRFQELAAKLRTSDSTALTLKQKLALEKYGALEKELAAVRSKVRELDASLALHVVVPMIATGASIGVV